MIKAVLFDAGGVLHVSNRAVSEDIQQELQLSEDQTSEIFRDFLKPLGIGKMTEEQVWSEVARRYKLHDITRKTEKLFSRAFEDTLQKMPGMYEFVDELKEKGIRVGLLSNVTPEFAEVLERHGHYDPFEIRILSCEVGLWKPDPEIYKLALKKLDLPPEEVIFVDDGKPLVEAANALGIHGVHFTDTEKTIEEVNKKIHKA